MKECDDITNETECNSHVEHDDETCEWTANDECLNKNECETLTDPTLCAEQVEDDGETCKLNES